MSKKMLASSANNKKYVFKALLIMFYVVSTTTLVFNLLHYYIFIRITYLVEIKFLLSPFFYIYIFHDQIYIYINGCVCKYIIQFDYMDIFML